MTTESFAAAMASALIPGGPLANGVAAPSAGRLFDEGALSAWLAQEESQPAIAAALAETGGAAAFLEATEARRLTALRAAEDAQRASFRDLVSRLLTLYYEHPQVLEAFGWRSAPPQPEGHDLEAADRARFARVAAQGAIWRDPG